MDNLELKKNLDNLTATIEMALAIDEQLKAEIEKAEALRKQIISDRRKRREFRPPPAHRFIA